MQIFACIIDNYFREKKKTKEELDYEFIEYYSINLIFINAMNIYLSLIYLLCVWEILSHRTPVYIVKIYKRWSQYLFEI